MVKKKNIKKEKFSLFTLLVIVSVIAGLLIGNLLRAYFHEYIPQANLFGETGLIKEARKPLAYNEGDFFRPLFGFTLWICLAFIVVFIINIFRKNFTYNFIRSFGYTESKKDKGNLYKHQFWLFWLIGMPILWTFIVMIFRGLIHLINYQFNTSLSEHWWIIIFWPIWLLYGFLSGQFKK